MRISIDAHVSKRTLFPEDNSQPRGKVVSCIRACSYRTRSLSSVHSTRVADSFIPMNGFFNNPGSQQQYPNKRPRVNYVVALVEMSTTDPHGSGCAASLCIEAHAHLS